MKKLLISLLFLIIGVQNTQAQRRDYIEALAEGKQLYAQELYYEAYLRFNAADVNSSQFKDAVNTNQEARVWMQKSIQGIVTQQAKTDSLIKRNQTIIDQFYFYDGRLALAYGKDKQGYPKYGFINKKGEAVILYQYKQATNFDEQTGYAKVEDKWLSPDGKEYPATTPIQNLPKITKTNPEKQETKQENSIEDLSKYKTQGTSNHHQALNEGIDKYHQRLFYDAFIRFNAASYSTDKALAKVGEELKQKSVIQIRLSFTQAKEVLEDTKRLLNAFYYYDDKFALAYNNNQYYFINPQGKPVEKLGKWDKVEQFQSSNFYDSYSFSKVWKENEEYWLDTLGNTHKVGYQLETLSQKIKVLNLSKEPEVVDITTLDLSKPFPTDTIDRLTFILQDLLDNIQLKVLILTGNRLKKIPLDIKKLENLSVFSLSYNSFDNFPEELFNIKNLKNLYLENTNITMLPANIKKLENIIMLNLRFNFLDSLPAEIELLQKLNILVLQMNKFSNFPIKICKLKELKELDLSHNHIQCLPVEIEMLKNLIILNLTYTGLNILPKEIGKLENLTTLYLDSNSLKNLPNEIGKLKKLKNLYLQNNLIPPQEQEKIKKLLPNCKIEF